MNARAAQMTEMDLTRREALAFLRGLSVGERFRFSLRVGKQITIEAGPVSVACAEPLGAGAVHQGVGWVAPDGVLVLAGPTLTMKAYKRVATRPGPSVLAHSRMLRVTPAGKVVEKLVHPKAWCGADRPAFAGSVAASARLVEKAVARGGTLWVWVSPAARTGLPHIAALPASRDADGKKLAALIANVRGEAAGCICRVTAADGKLAVAASTRPRKVSDAIRAVLAAHAAEMPALEALRAANIVGFKAGAAAAIQRVEAA